MKLNLYFGICILVAGLFTACQKNDSSGKVAIDDTHKQSDVGPFEIQFNEKNIYVHQFDVPIMQAEGKIEYNSKTTLTSLMKVEDIYSEVKGCDTNPIKMELIWFADAELTSGEIVNVGSTLKTIPGKQSRLIVWYKGLSGCQHLTLHLKLSRMNSEDPTTPTLPRPPSVQVPDNFIGDWNMTYSSGFSLEMSLTRKTDGSVQMNYASNCRAGFESFIGTVVVFNTKKTPNVFNVRIDKVPQRFIGGCSNVFGVEESDIGKYINCIGERRSESRFKLSCNMGATMDNVPRKYDSYVSNENEVDWETITW